MRVKRYNLIPQTAKPFQPVQRLHRNSTCIPIMTARWRTPPPLRPSRWQRPYSGWPQGSACCVLQTVRRRCACLKQLSPISPSIAGR